jgi:HEAT repeat
VKREQLYRVWAVLLLAFLAGLGAVAFWPEEPRYDGKTLSEWLALYEYGRLGNSTFSEAQKRTEIAIGHMGVRALPCLVKWIQYEGRELPWWKNAMLIIACKFQVKGSRVWNVSNGRSFYIPGSSLGWLINDSATKRADYAYRYGFKLVGPPAVAALPDLLRLSESTNTVVSARAKYAMITIPNLLPQIVKMLTNDTATVRYCGVHGLNTFESLSHEFPGIDTSSLVPPLVQRLQDPDIRIRNEATNALSKIAPETLSEALR